MKAFVKFSRQQRIANTLLLQSSFINNLGLLNGKMGIAIYFYLLSSKTQNPIYENYGGELIDEIYEEIHSRIPSDFENGLAGIGWGIEYLIQKKYIDADTNEVLEEFDELIFKNIALTPPKNIGLTDGLGGYILYFLTRIQNKEIKKEKYDSIIIILNKLIDSLDEFIFTSNKDSHFNEPDKFDIIWDYSSLVWILIEVGRVRSLNSKAGKLLIRLINPIITESIQPKLQSHRLLIALGLEKLNHCEFIKISNIQNSIINLLKDIKREDLKEEISNQNVYLRHGLQGLVFIYKNLFQLTQKAEFNEEAEFWNRSIFNENHSEQDFTKIFKDPKSDQIPLGILNGISGIEIY